MHDFEKWKVDNAQKIDDYEQFKIYFEEHNAEQNFHDVVIELAYQVYELQCCVESLIDDIENIQ